MLEEGMALKSCLHMAALLVYPTNSEVSWCMGAALKFSDLESSEQSRDGLKVPGCCGFSSLASLS